MKSGGVNNGKGSSQNGFLKHGKPLVQAKLMVNAPGDRYEKEADAMADRVMQQSDARPSSGNWGVVNRSVQRKCAECEEREKKKKGSIQRMPLNNYDSTPPALSHGVLGQTIQRCAACDAEKKKKDGTIMRKEAGTGTFAAPSELGARISSAGSGSPLPEQSRQEMETAFDNDLSSVRVHTDQQAASMNHDVNARAFTYGNDIFFNAGQYSPKTSDGKRLLAHEITHTIQQGQSIGSPISTIQRQPAGLFVDDNLNAGDILASNYSFLNDLLTDEQKDLIQNAFDGYEKARQLRAQLNWEDQGHAYESAPGVLTQLPEGEQLVRKFSKKIAVEEARFNKLSIEIPSSNLILQQLLLEGLDFQANPEKAEFLSRFYASPVEIHVDPDKYFGSRNAGDDFLQYYWRGQHLMQSWRTSQGALDWDALIGSNLTFTDVPDIGSMLKIVNESIDSYLSAYRIALDKLDVYSISAIAPLLEISIAAFKELGPEFRKLQYVAPKQTWLSWDRMWLEMHDSIPKRITKDVSLQIFRGTMILGSLKENMLEEFQVDYVYNYEDKLIVDYIRNETLNILITISDLNKIIEAISEKDPSIAIVFKLPLLLYNNTGKAVNIEFKLHVLRTLGLLDKVEAAFSWDVSNKLENKAQRIRKQFGDFSNVGDFDLDKASSLLSTGWTDWRVSPSESGEVFNMLMSASPRDRNKIFEKMGTQLSTLTIYLGWRQLEILWQDSIGQGDRLISDILFDCYDREHEKAFKGKSLREMQSENGIMGKIDRVFTGIITVGASEAIGANYENEREGNISSLQSHQGMAISSIIAVASIPIGGEIGAAFGNLAKSAAVRLGGGKVVQFLSGMLGAGIAEGASSTFAVDVLKILAGEQKELSPWTAYLVAAGISTGARGLGGYLEMRAAAKSAGQYGEQMAPVVKAMEVDLNSAKRRMIDEAIKQNKFEGDFGSFVTQEIKDNIKNIKKGTGGYEVEVPIRGTEHSLARKTVDGKKIWCLLTFPKGCGYIEMAADADELVDDNLKTLSEKTHDEIEQEFKNAGHEKPLADATSAELGGQLDDLKNVTEKQAAVRVAEAHHIATLYRNPQMRQLFEAHGFTLDENMNLIGEFEEHGQIRGWERWDVARGRYVHMLRGHHPDYHRWVSARLFNAVEGLNPAQAAQALENELTNLREIIRQNPEVLAYGPMAFMGSPNALNLIFGL